MAGVVVSLCFHSDRCAVCPIYAACTGVGVADRVFPTC